MSAAGERIGRAKRVLALAVVGGNDSVSSLATMRQLQADFGMASGSIAVPRCFRPACNAMAAQLPMTPDPI